MGTGRERGAEIGVGSEGTAAQGISETDLTDLKIVIIEIIEINIVTLPNQAKKQLLSMFLEDKNPEKDFKGKENGDLEHLLENNRKERKDLEKKLSSEWS